MHCHWRRPRARLQKLGLPILNPWSIMSTIVIIGIATIGTGIIGTTGVTAKSTRTKTLIVGVDSESPSAEPAAGIFFGYGPRAMHRYRIEAR